MCGRILRLSVVFSCAIVLLTCAQPVGGKKEAVKPGRDGLLQKLMLLTREAGPPNEDLIERVRACMKRVDEVFGERDWKPDEMCEALREFHAQMELNSSLRRTLVREIAEKGPEELHGEIVRLTKETHDTEVAINSMVWLSQLKPKGWRAALGEWIKPMGKAHGPVFAAVLFVQEDAGEGWGLGEKRFSLGLLTEARLQAWKWLRTKAREEGE